MSAATYAEKSSPISLLPDSPEAVSPHSAPTVIEQREYSNGVMHFYEVDNLGKKRHIGHKEILAAYGHEGDTQGRRPLDFSQSLDSMNPQTKAAFFENSNNAVEARRVESRSHRKRGGHLAALVGGIAMFGASSSGSHLDRSNSAKTEVSQPEQSKKRRRFGAAVVAGALVVGSVLWAFNQDNGNNHHQDIAPGQHNTATPQEVKPGKQIAPKKQHQVNQVAGFVLQARVEHGNGYTQELQDLAAQKEIHLSASESYAAYQRLAHQFRGNLLVSDPSYRLPSGDWGISSPGSVKWEPEVVRSFNNWLKAAGKASK